MVENRVPSGAYIVRVKTIHNIETQEKVSYIKLVNNKNVFNPLFFMVISLIKLGRNE